jgi:alkylhydroperoxidase family enzyme
MRLMIISDKGRTMEWEDIHARFPEAAEAVADLHRVIWDANDPVMLELCRLRIAMLLDFKPGLVLRTERARQAGLSEDKIGSLSLWPTSPLFTSRERACLALTEQILLEAKGVTDEMVAEVLRHLSPSECYSLVEAISAMETLQRGALILGFSTSPEAVWIGSPEKESNLT